MVLENGVAYMGTERDKDERERLRRPSISVILTAMLTLLVSLVLRYCSNTWLSVGIVSLALMFYRWISVINNIFGLYFFVVCPVIILVAYVISRTLMSSAAIRRRLYLRIYIAIDTAVMIVFGIIAFVYCIRHIR